jgi:hypothetical protein
MFNIGVVGYSSQDFDEKIAKILIYKCFDEAEEYADNEEIAVVSGLTNLGIPKLAYEEASERGWKTIGVACKKAEEYDLFEVDETFIVGGEWGDEREKFLSMLDFLVRVGGGKQSLEEVKIAKEKGIKTIEVELKSK